MQYGFRSSTTPIFPYSQALATVIEIRVIMDMDHRPIWEIFEKDVGARKV
jgi:hypothetical protein